MLQAPDEDIDQEKDQVIYTSETANRMNVFSPLEQEAYEKIIKYPKYVWMSAVSLQAAVSLHKGCWRVIMPLFPPTFIRQKRANKLDFVTNR